MIVLGGCDEDSSPTTPQAAVSAAPPGQCSVSEENETLLAYLQDEYYWYLDIPSGLVAADFSTPQALLAGAMVPQDR